MCKTNRTEDDFLECRLGNGPIYPVSSDDAQRLLPELLVTRKQEVVRVAGAKGAKVPLVKIRGRAIGTCLQRLCEADDAITHDFRRQSVSVGLEWIRCGRLLGVDRGEPIVGEEGIGQQIGNQILRVLI